MKPIPPKSLNLSKDELKAKKENKKEPTVGFHVRISKKLDKKLQLHLAQLPGKITRQAWLIEVLDKL